MSMSAEQILERLQARYPVLIDLSLERLAALLARLDHPERRLPPVIHVAGTNGKGSTIAFMRAIAEAAGLAVHVTTSPHLVSVTERYRLAGRLADEATLVAALERIEAADTPPSVTVFEAMIAAAFLLFAAHPADLALVEVGLGGRYDATNLIPPPRVAAITSISLDHQAFLGDRVEIIAAEKAGIIKPGVACVTGRQSAAVLAVLDDEAARAGTTIWARDRDYTIDEAGEETGEVARLVYRDPFGRLDLPVPALLGPHQIDNAGIAVAALRRAALPIGPADHRALVRADWPARLQRLSGALARSLPDGFDLWLDGGHNEGAARALAAFVDRAWRDRPLHLVVGMKETKDVAAFLAPLASRSASLWAVREAGQHLALPVEQIVDAAAGAARPGPDVAGALGQIARTQPPGRVLICGSLYLAGEVLKHDAPPT